VKIALLSIGDELLCGETVDTNAAQIAARLYDSGLEVSRQMTVGDRQAAIAGALVALANDHDTIIATGGLGPTSDDVTAEAAAAATGDSLVRNEAAHAHLVAFFRSRGRELFPQNEKQAYLPSRATVIPNPTGTACGFRTLLGSCHLYVLPGVPSEMRPMVEESVIPAVRERAGLPMLLRTRVLTVFGISEAQVGQLLSDLTLDGVRIAYCVQFPLIQVRLRLTASPESGAATLDAAAQMVRSRLGDAIVAEDRDTMETVVARLLDERGLTVAVAESCSGGLLAKHLTDISGSSSYMRAGVVAYANDAKSRLLGVPAELIERHGAVSEEVAAAMAEGVRSTVASDLALAVTGIAGPTGGTDDKPVGTVFLSLCDQNGCRVRELRLSGSREQVRVATTYHALDWLRRHLLAADPGDRGRSRP